VFASSVTRQGAVLIAVVVTDSPIQLTGVLTNQANSVKGLGARVIGVGIRVDTNTVNALYALSSNRYAVSVSDYSQLPSVVSSVTQRWGCFPPPPPLPTTTTTRPPPVGRYFLKCDLHILLHCLFSAFYTIIVLGDRERRKGKKGSLTRFFRERGTHQGLCQR